MGTALVLAGTSFVGQHLCQTLRTLSIKVIATARGANLPAGVELCDLTNREQVDALLARFRPEWIFQCGAATRSKDPEVCFAVHVGGALNILSAAFRHTPQARIVLLGSASEYGSVGPASLPVSEDYPPSPTSFFGASKLAQTITARAAAAEWQLSVSVVRPFNVLGPGLPNQYFAASLAARLLQAKASGGPRELPVINAEATRDFVDVRDLADALVHVIKDAPTPRGELGLYNVASGQEVTVGALAQHLCQLAGDFQAVSAGAGESRSGINRSCGDASRLRQATGWTPRISWQQSLQDMWSALQDGPR